MPRLSIAWTNSGAWSSPCRKSANGISAKVVPSQSQSDGVIQLQNSPKETSHPPLTVGFSHAADRLDKNKN